jgi:hypothetical protein
MLDFATPQVFDLIPYLLRTYSMFKLTLATLQKKQIKYKQTVDLDNDTIESQENKKKLTQ